MPHASHDAYERAVSLWEAGELESLADGTLSDSIAMRA